MRIYYSITTIDPVIISQNNATTNNHECLDYIPGSAILGVVAARLYAKLSAEQSWDVFHSGATKFGPCYPVFNNQLALPTPACWHYPKGQKVTIKASSSDIEKYNSAYITNQACEMFEREEGVQYKQCRDGYVTANAEVARVEKGLITKTAIDRTTGIAKDQQLFSYSYIDAGQTFIGWVDCNNEELLEKIRLILTADMRIGRSRNTEFGRVRAKIIDEIAMPEPKSVDNQLVLWCLSDCECLNDKGLPTYVPHLSDLIPGISGSLDFTKSFIRTSKISRFNQKRHGYDTEQLLINKGSVLVYKDVKYPVSQKILRKLTNEGIGINKQQGLGWVMVNPDWVMIPKLSENKLFDGIVIPQQRIEDTEVKPTSILTRWVADKVLNEMRENLASNDARSLLKQVIIAYRNARQYNNITDTGEVGPSRNQWNRITDELRINNTEWKDKLFDQKHGICKEDNDEYGWGITWHNGEKLISFSEHLGLILSKKQIPVILEFVSMINRYDLSTSRGIEKASLELRISPDEGTTENMEVIK